MTWLQVPVPTFLLCEHGQNAWTFLNLSLLIHTMGIITEPTILSFANYKSTKQSAGSTLQDASMEKVYSRCLQLLTSVVAPLY